MITYIQCDDCKDGKIYVKSFDNQEIMDEAVFDYETGPERWIARMKAGELAAKLAKDNDCTWDRNW